MRSKRLNIIILLALWAFTVGAGTYFTFFAQRTRLAQIDEAEKALHIQRSEFRDLSLLEGKMREEIRFAAHRWQARYKNVGDSLSTADVIEYVNRFADLGFTTFNAEFTGVHSAPHHQYYTFALRGDGPFEHLYDFIWHMENNRDLYRIEDVVINRASESESGDVQFTMTLQAYFGTSAAVSAAAVSRSVSLHPDAPAHSTDPSSSATSSAVELSVATVDADLPMVPDSVLPARRLRVDPFGGHRPNAAITPAGGEPVSPGRGLYSLGEAELISIVGSVALFNRAGEIRKVQVGDKVREGKVVRVDPERQRVTVEEWSGVTAQFDMKLEPLFRRFAGSRTAAPIG